MKDIMHYAKDIGVLELLSIQSPVRPNHHIVNQRVGQHHQVLYFNSLIIVEGLPKTSFIAFEADVGVSTLLEASSQAERIQAVWEVVNGF